MSSALATPLSSIRIASSEAIRSSRLVAKPGTSRTVSESLPSASTKARASVSALSEVAVPRTNSTSLIDQTGLKKCIPRKVNGSVTASASRSIDSALVLEASRRGRRAAHRASTSSLRSSRSGIDSTISASPSARSSTTATRVIRPANASPLARSSLPRPIADATASSIVRRMTSAWPASGSTTATAMPASAAT